MEQQVLKEYSRKMTVKYRRNIKLGESEQLKQKLHVIILKKIQTTNLLYKCNKNKSGKILNGAYTFYRRTVNTTIKPN